MEGKNDWKKVEVEAETPEGEIFVVEIIFELDGKGQVWLDDFYFGEKGDENEFKNKKCSD